MPQTTVQQATAEWSISSSASGFGVEQKHQNPIDRLGQWQLAEGTGLGGAELRDGGDRGADRWIIALGWRTPNDPRRPRPPPARRCRRGHRAGTLEPIHTIQHLAGQRARNVVAAPRPQRPVPAPRESPSTASRASGFPWMSYSARIFTARSA